MPGRKDDPREHLKRIQRQLRKAGRLKLKPASKLSAMYEEIGEQAVADWVEAQRQRAMSGLAPEAPPEVRERQEVHRISVKDFRNALVIHGEDLSYAVAQALLDPEVQSHYREWTRDAEHPINVLLAVTEDPLSAWYGDIVLGAEPSADILKQYLIEHAVELRETMAARPARELAAEFRATLAEPEEEPPFATIATKTAEGKETRVATHKYRGPAILEAGQWRGLPHGVGEDPGTYSVFPSPDDPRFWEYAARVRKHERRRAVDQKKVFDQALENIRAKGGDERRAAFWVRVHNRMMQLGEQLLRKRGKRRREYFGGASKSGTYHAGHRAKRKRRK